MTVQDVDLIKQRLAELRAEHRALDEAIAGLTQNVYFNQLHLRRLKKRKLQLKDIIARYESKLIPDLDA
ncbi:MAG: YdcH family protein [Gammaproteobacteria bacterium]